MPPPRTRRSRVVFDRQHRRGRPLRKERWMLFGDEHVRRYRQIGQGGLPLERRHDTYPDDNGPP
jgi:hypothetical protein